MKRCDGAVFSVLLAAAPLAAQPLQSPGDAGVSASKVAVENCIGSERLALHFGEDSAVLDTQDLEGMRGLIAARFPALGGTGFAPLQLVLWHRPVGDWVYVAIAAHAQKPGGVCFSATISAQPFTESEALRRKYRIGGVRT